MVGYILIFDVLIYQKKILLTLYLPNFSKPENGIFMWGLIYY